mgnify:CR=1 FL=1
MEIYRKHLDFFNHDVYRTIRKIPLVRKICRKLQWREKKLFFTGGQQKDKVFYVVRIDPMREVGVFAYYRYVLGKVRYALEKEYIPVVDMQNYSNVYTGWPNTSGQNAWEFFFEQPFGISINDVRGCKNIILSSIDTYEKNMSFNDYGANKELMEQAERYIRFNESLRLRIDEKYKELFTGRGKVCGIKLRGTDYNISKLKKHAIPPDVEDVYDEIEKVINEVWHEKFDYFFLSTEDQAILEFMQNKYGNRLLYLQVERYLPDEIWYNVNKSVEERRKEGIEYCLDVALLAKCNSLIAGRCQGAGSAVLINNGQYEHLHVIDRGFF